MLIAVLNGKKLVAVSTVALVVLAGVSLAHVNFSNFNQDTDGNNSAKYIFSSLHDIKIETYHFKQKNYQDGGAIAGNVGNEYLLVTGNGIVAKFNARNQIENVEKLGQIEFGLDEYKKYAPSPNRWYRIADAIFLEDLDTLFYSYIYWSRENQCFTIRVSQAPLSLLESEQILDGELIFESLPCVNHDIANNETGGRFLRLSTNELLFTIGSFKAEPLIPLAEFKQSSYGKTFKIDLTTSQVTNYSKGHRNAQGLVNCDDKVYLTEHGPFGGDELNLLIEGNDYGWPESSFGVDYGKKVLTMSGETGQHLNGVKPLYAWTPSIGISNLICYKSDLFENWQGDLLIASLNGLGSGLSLFRTRLFEDRPVAIEQIKVDSKVRDLTSLDGGEILTWDGLSKVSILTPAQSVFSQCVACHNLRYRSHGIGPDLWGVVGADIARHTDRYNYSDALKSLDGTWSQERLHAFLEDPSGFAPGTTMHFPGVKSYEDRQEIIDYLQGVSNSR
nr:PQQ-dependent sugar dehydrogenase [Alteromonas ponticola]